MVAAIHTIEDFTAQVEAELRDVLSSRQTDLYRMMWYHLGWEDERGNPREMPPGRRRHGVACLTACHAAGGDAEVAIPAAASVELANSFTEVHDDVQGGQPSRDQRDAVWWVWGPAQAINAGDGMHALARLALFRLQGKGVAPDTTFRAVQLLDEASLELCEGRFQDLEAQEKLDLTVDAYLAIAYSKTAALYSCAMKLGALVASAEEKVVESLGVCGARAGLALQVRADLNELWGDGQPDRPPGNEVLNKKKLLPIVYALEKANINQKRRMGDIFFKRVLEPGDVPPLRELLDELGAREFCEKLAQRHRDEAHEALAEAGLPQDRAHAVKDFIDWVLPSA